MELKVTLSKLPAQLLEAESITWSWKVSHRPQKRLVDIIKNPLHGVERFL